MVTQCLAPLDAHQVSKRFADNRFRDGLAGLYFLRERAGTDGLPALQRFRGINKRLAAGLTAEFGRFQGVINLLRLLVMLDRHNDGKLAREGDLDGGSPSFVCDFAQLTKVSCGQICTPREKAVVQSVQQSRWKRQFAYFEGGDFVAKLAQVLAYFTEPLDGLPGSTAGGSSRILRGGVQSGECFASLANTFVGHRLNGSLNSVDGRGFQFNWERSKFLRPRPRVSETIGERVLKRLANAAQAADLVSKFGIASLDELVKLPLRCLPDKRINLF